MKRTLFFLTLSAGSLFAQMEAKQQQEMKVLAETMHTAGVAAFSASSHTVTGSPYSATVVNESVQTLADGNRIVQKSSGTTARDSSGRTRNDATLPLIGNMSAAGAPHLVFIVDPVAEKSYTLNLDEKTAHAMGHKMPGVPPPPPGPGVEAGPMKMNFIGRTATFTSDMAPMPLSLSTQKMDMEREQSQARTEDLGMQVIEGVNAQGTRTTRTIAAGEIGNEKAIDIVTEVWISPELKTIVMSKRSDPRTGEQTFRLTNITRAEPDASLFTVPADFKTSEIVPDRKMFFVQS
ncbi:MAG TPA: hypothetical protein VKT81_06200, partial [Bryobacteraceae bacterium]|nr:hypothetical protein [Bryobacteraceae bacterium]